MGGAFHAALLPGFLLAACAAPPTGPDRPPRILPELGVQTDGTATAAWTAGIAVALGREAAEDFARQRIELSPGARAWWEVLQASPTAVSCRAGQLAPYFDLQAFDARVVAGNRGSSDAFAWGGTFIGINLNAFGEAYGAPEEGALDRMVRIVAHEYMHLLTYATYPNHRDLRTTPFERALWTLFLEGLGDYVSVSSRWLPESSGAPSPVAARTLEGLEPILVERLEALSRCGPEHEVTEAELRRGLTTGRFDQKWGSLTVALWLHSEAALRGEEAVLREFIRQGPAGVLPLARRRIRPDLRPRLEALD